MCIEFEQWKLLEFFDEEEILEANGVCVRYNIKTGDNSIFSLYIEPYDEYANVSLTRSDKLGALAGIIFEVSFKNVCKIDCTKTELLIYKKTPQNWYDTADFIITVKPNVRLSLDL